MNLTDFWMTFVTSQNKTMEKDVLLDVAPVERALREFAHDRDWDQFHSPKNLSMALSAEVGELTEIFQWMTEDQSRTAGDDLGTAQAVRDELADVQLYLVRLASVLGVDLNRAVADKLQKNALKYPVDKSRGTSKKYTQI